MTSDNLKSIAGKLAELRYEAEKLIGARKIPEDSGCGNIEDKVYADLENLVNSIDGLGIKPIAPDEIRIPLSQGGALLIYDKQDCVYPGCGVQYEAPSKDQFDIALIETVGSAEDDYDPDKIRVYVYADESQDDWTNKFEISRKLLEDITIPTGKAE